MSLNRRGFLGALAAGLVIDPERALWVPGRKLISIPKPRQKDLHYLATEFELDPSLVLSYQEFRQRYIDPAIESVNRSINREAELAMSRPIQKVDMLVGPFKDMPLDMHYKNVKSAKGEFWLQTFSKHIPFVQQHENCRIFSDGNTFHVDTLVEL